MSTAAQARDAYEAAKLDDAAKATAVTTAQNSLNDAKAAKSAADGVVTSATTVFASILHSAPNQMRADYSKTPPVIYACPDGVTIQELDVPDLNAPDEEPAPPAPEPAPATPPSDEPQPFADPNSTS